MLIDASPVYGVIFLFKYIGSSKSGLQDGSYDTTIVEEDGLFFAAQTIQNACGTQAILSVILNNDVAAATGPTRTPAQTEKAGIEIGADLREFKDFTTGFPPELRGEALSNSSLIRTTHNSFARSSPFADETQRDPAAGTEDVFHFIGYTVYNDKLYELDGLQPYPISHGQCSPDEFPEKILPVLQKRIERYPAGEVRFNLMAVCRDLRIGAQDISDSEALAREKKKRRQWEWENTLRRHNFVGFTGEIMKGVTKMKVEKGEYHAWIADAKKVTEQRMKDRRAKGAAAE